MFGSTRKQLSTARRGRRAKVFPAALLAALTAATGAIPALGASQIVTEGVAIASDSLDAGTFHVFYFEPTTFTTFNVHIEADAVWNASLTTNVGWDGDDVRQGADLDVSRQALFGSGTMDVTWTVTGTISPLNGLFGDIGVGDTITENVACNPKFSGGDYICSASAPAWTVIPGFGPATPYVKLAVTTAFTITPEGALVARELLLGGQAAAGPEALGLDNGLDVDHLALPCTAAAGDAVGYALSDYSWSPEVTGHGHLSAAIGQMDPVTGTVELPALGVALGDLDFSPAFDLQGDGFVASLGTVLANNSHPTIEPLGPFSGIEGSPISFGANVDSACTIGSSVWEFSDGTKSFGPSPKRAFGDDGEYDGQLTVTDVTGLASTRAFSVDVSNVAPSANAGPDTYADWGRLLQFNGQATDPGSDDQGTLEHEWLFGDGTPIATGGASVLHAYAMPGTYTATFTACDDDAACDEDARTVIVTKRDTVLGYTGPVKAGPKKAVTLTATLVDEYGQPVVGRKVTFSIGSQSALGTTDGSGNATVSLKLSQKPGSYPLAVAFPAGDARYYDSVDAGMTFVIGNK